MQMKLPSLALLPLCAAIACGRSGQAGWSAADESLQRFAVSIQGEDIGYMQIEIDRMDGDSVRLHEETVWDLVLMGTSRHVVMELDATADSTLNLSRLDFHLTDGSAEIGSTTIRDGQE